VWVVVDVPGPRGDFTTVQEAVAAAADGDVVLVEEGAVGFVTLDGKGLTIQAEAGTSAQLVSVFVKNLAPTQAVVVRGLALSGIEIENAQGPVWIDDCDAGVLVAHASPKITLTRSSFVGLSGGWDFPLHHISHPTPAIRAVNSSLAIEDCTVTGGRGADSGLSMVGPVSGQPGDAGLELDGGRAWIAASEVVGGAGGDGALADWFTCFGGSDGGPGLRLHGSNPRVTSLDTSVGGGPGGLAAPACGPFGGPSLPGNDGPPTEVLSGLFFPLGGAARGFDATSPVREGANIQFTFDGAPGELALLLVSTTPDHQFRLFLNGVLAVGPPLTVIPLVPIPAGGVLSFPVAVPALPPALEGHAAYFQAVFCAGSCVLGPGSPVVVLDASIL
jgi:hypothetical protein